MSNPRYVPRSFAITPHLFGKSESIDWIELPSGADKRVQAQRSAARTQHQISYGVQSLYMPQSSQPKITLLAEELDVPYGRLHRVLTGRVVMQLEDIGRLRVLIGPQLDYWFLREGTRRAVSMAEAHTLKARGQGTSHTGGQVGVN